MSISVTNNAQEISREAPNTMKGRIEGSGGDVDPPELCPDENVVAYALPPSTDPVVMVSMENKNMILHRIMCIINRKLKRL